MRNPGARRSAAVASTTDRVIKPDHSARRRHFIFTDEHDALRESIRSFVERDLAPHADEWEETTFPDWVFRRKGELGFLGLDKPERYGGQAIAPTRSCSSRGPTRRGPRGVHPAHRPDGRTRRRARAPG